MEVLFARTIEGVEDSLESVLRLGSASPQLFRSIDRAMGAESWLLSVKDAQLGDAVPLIAHDLVRASRPEAVDPACVEQRLFQAICSMSSEDLYALLTEQAKLRLGLMRGFRLILALERSNARDARRHLAIWLTLDLCRRQDMDGLNVFAERVLGQTRCSSASPPPDCLSLVQGTQRGLNLR